MTYAMLLNDVQNAAQVTLPDHYGTMNLSPVGDRNLFGYIGRLVRLAKHHFHH